MRIHGEVRTSLQYEKTVLGKLLHLRRKSQRSCFRVRSWDLLKAGVYAPAGEGVSVPSDPEVRIGRIVSFLAEPGQYKQGAASFILARVQLYEPPSESRLEDAAAYSGVELWHHNYTLIDHTCFTTHLIPAHLIGPLVVIIPHPQPLIANLGYCLVLQKAY